MDDKELDLDLDQIEVNEDKKLQVRNRYQQLATAKIQAQTDKEVAEKARAEAEAKSAKLEKDTEFYKTFNQISSKYPESTNFQDKIKEKVDQGYDLEDAAVSVLNKEGKFTQVNQPIVRPQAEGGSSITNVSEGDKSSNEMNQGEKLEALRELERSGELSQILRAGINRS